LECKIYFASVPFRSKFILRRFWSAKFILRRFWSAKFILLLCLFVPNLFCGAFAKFILQNDPFFGNAPILHSNAYAK